MTLVQKGTFLEIEADQWFQRNRSQLSPDRGDLVTDALVGIGAKPTRVLEIGCANGWRLDRLRRRFSCTCSGVEPSSQAIQEGRSSFPDLDLRVGTADELPFEAGSFDLVVYGFCLYLVDPSLHLRCVAEGDRVLRDGGLLLVFDFVVPFPYHNPYAHHPGLSSYKLEFSRYFLAHPAYNLVHRQLDLRKSDLLDPDRREGVDVLLKNMKHAFPMNPYSRR